MKKIVAIICVGIACCILITSISPRFGRKLNGNSTKNPYLYIMTTSNGAFHTDTYYNYADSTITIMYSDRLSRALTISCTDEDTVTMRIKMDRGCTGDSLNQTHTNLNWILYDIIAKDSSGSFFLIYAKSIITNLFGIFLLYWFNKNKEKLPKIPKILCLSVGTVLLVCSILLSARFL